MRAHRIFLVGLRFVVAVLGLLCMAALCGCGGGGGSSSNDGNNGPPVTTPPTPKSLTGYFLAGAAVQGLPYKSCSTEGFTGPQGDFTFSDAANCSVTFTGFGTVQLVNAQGGVGNRVLTPYKLSTDPVVRSNLLRGLQAFDKDGNLANGIEISRAFETMLESRKIDWASTDLPAALRDALADAASVDGTPHSLSDKETAEANFFASMRSLLSGVYTGGWTQSALPSGPAIPKPQSGLFAAVITPRADMTAGAFIQPIDPDCSLRFNCRFYFTTAKFSSLTWSLGDLLTITAGQTDGGRSITGDAQWAVNPNLTLKATGGSDVLSATGSPAMDDSSTLPVLRFTGLDARSNALQVDVDSSNHIVAVLTDLESVSLTDAGDAGSDRTAKLTGTLEGDTVHAQGKTTSSNSTQTTYELNGTIRRASLTFEGSITQTTLGHATTYTYDAAHPLYGSAILPQ